MTTLRTEAFSAQAARWPATGRHILAQYDDASVVVYQAYRPSIGQFTADAGYFGGGFSLGRMSWIKPNFLWMMYRCGWATKDGQEVVLAIWIERAGFDEILARAVPSSFDQRRYADHATWSAAVASSEVRLQWDPDHDPYGKPVDRGAIQLGLRGAILASYARPWIRRVEDITPYVRDQHARLKRDGLGALETPSERPYPCVASTAAALDLAAA